jgi:antitoxin component YwqK of YwqJK toxin-antitoxin module
MTEYIEYIEKEELDENALTPPRYENVKLIKIKGLLVNGKREGKWIEGNITYPDCIYYTQAYYNYEHSEINYIDDLKQGEFTIYINDSIHVKGFYKDDKLDGEYKEYNYKGIYKITYYENGIWINEIIL